MIEFTDGAQANDAADFRLVRRDLTLVLAGVAQLDGSYLKRPRVGRGDALRFKAGVVDERVIADREQVTVAFPHPAHLSSETRRRA